ncbi:MAG: hypothetical protein K8823_715 [Cenarchaeum symbiont of Oopsacas minuta]|nr:hypothetical protein [Cenarchaeum symbiont of Oopsacas minuta]
MMVITAKSYTNKMSGGVYTSSHLIKGSDGKHYVIKIPPKNDHRSNLNEYLGCRIGKYFGLPVLDSITIKLTKEFLELARDDLGNEVDEGEYFATLKQDRYEVDVDRIKNMDTNNIINQDDVSKFIIFDIFIDNIDRNSGNYFFIHSSLDPKKMQYILIDHGHIFGGPQHDFNGVNILPYRFEIQPWNLRCITLKKLNNASRYITTEFGLDVMKMYLDEAPLPWKLSYGDENISAVKESMVKRDKDQILNVVLNNSEIHQALNYRGIS